MSTNKVFEMNFGIRQQTSDYIVFEEINMNKLKIETGLKAMKLDKKILLFLMTIG